MSKLSTKLAVLCVSSALTGLAVFAVLRTRRASSVLEFGQDRLSMRNGDEKAVANEVESKTVASERGVAALGVRDPIFPPSTFRRWYLTPEEVGLLIGQHDNRTAFDPFAHFTHRPHVDQEFDWEEAPRGKWRIVTNGLGMREDVEVLATPPDLRVLVVGDSHTDGMCDNVDSFPNALERLLAGARPERTVEVLNAGVSSYTFYNYLGTLERFLDLQPDVCIVAVFGGNDFEEALTLYHLFQHTVRPGGLETYREAWDKAKEIHGPCLGQAFNEVMYFTHNPDQVEVAMQCARDVTSEILATCSRHGIDPVFLYIPPPFSADSGWSEHEPTIKAVLDTLGLKREDTQVVEQMADSYLAYLKSRGVPYVDMRPIYRARQERMYWMRDHHTTVAANRVIAEALSPLVLAARPPSRERVRRAIGARPATSPQARQALLSPGAPELDGPTISLHELPNEPLVPPWKLVLAGAFALPSAGADAIAQLVELDATREFDPQSWWRYKPQLDVTIQDASSAGGAWRLRTNKLGLRSTSEPASDALDLRVLVTGDEQVLGTCADDETCVARLEASLRGRHGDKRIECLDATCAGYGLHNYLGVFARLSALKPDAFVVCVSGGTDFEAALRSERTLRSNTEQAPLNGVSAEAQRVLATDPTASEQFLRTLERFHEHPDDARDAVRFAVDVTNELHRCCTAAGIQLVVAYLPPAHEVEWDRCAARIKPLADQLGLSDKDLHLTTRMATNYLSYLRGLGIEVIDMTPVLRQLPGPHYVEGRFVLDNRAQARLAEFVRLSLEHRSPKLRE